MKFLTPEFLEVGPCGTKFELIAKSVEKQTYENSWLNVVGTVRQP